MNDTPAGRGVKAAAKDLLRPYYKRLRFFIKSRLPALYRDGNRYDDIAAEIRRLRPAVIVEIGACEGENAERMLFQALRFGPVKYFGFDLFEEMDGATFRREAALWPGSLAGVEARLKTVRAAGRAPEVRLYKGDTAATLPAAAADIGRADLIFIDGGHSLETVRADWENSQRLCGPGTVIYFDDYPNWGVGPVVDAIDRAKWDVEVLAPGDFYYRHTPPLNCRLARVTPRPGGK